MEFEAFQAALAVKDGSLALTGATLPGAGFDRMLAAFNKGSPLVIAEATETIAGNTISVTGNAAFANVSGAAVSGQLSLDGSGNPQALLRMQMSAGWNFSRSFPDPIAGGTARAQLDALQISDAFLVFASQAGTDISGAPLVAGLNVVATLHLKAVAALIDAALASQTTAVLHASVTPPSAAASPPLPYGGSPWDALGWTVPGIAAEAGLGIELALGEAKLGDVRVRFYSPPSSEWLASNRSYRPRRGLAGRLTLEGAGIDAELSGDLSPSAKSLQVSAAVTGATFDKLECLVGIAPEKSFANALPDALAGIGNIAVTQVAIAFQDSLSQAAMSLLGLTIGFPLHKWEVFDGIYVQISSVKFLVSQPFSKDGRVSAIVCGTLEMDGQPLEITTELPRLVVRGELPAGRTVTSTAFCLEHAPELKSMLPALTIDELSFYLEPGERGTSWWIAAAMADDSPWRFEIGPFGVMIADVAMELSKQDSEDAQGTLSGLLILDEELSATAEYHLPGELMVRAQLPNISLSRLVSLLDQTQIKLPQGFDPMLVEPHLLLDKDSGGERFTAATQIEGLGALAFTAQRQDGKTGVAVGVELDGAASTVPGLEALLKFEALVGLTDLLLVVSTLEQQGFQLPAMASFGEPALANAKLKLPPQAGGLVKGLNVYAKINAASNRALQALAHWLDVKLDGTVWVTIGVSLPSPTTNSKLLLAVNTTVNGVLVQGDLGLSMESDEPSVFLGALANATIQSQPVRFDVTASALPNGALVEGSMQGAALTFGPVTVSDLALVVGINLDGVPTLGFAGAFDIPKVSFGGSLAILLDSTYPEKSLLAGSVNELTLKTIVQALAPEAPIPSAIESTLSRISLKGLHTFTLPATLTAALDGHELATISQAFRQHGGIDLPTSSSQALLVISEAGRQWHLTDLTTMTHYTLLASSDGIDVSLDPQVYIAPQHVRIGGIAFQQGVHIEGKLDLLVAEVCAKIEATSSGITADAQADPIELGDDKLLKITDATGLSGPRLSLSTYAQAQQQPLLDQPHFLLSGRVNVLGLEVASTEIEIDTSGLLVDISNTTATGVTIELKGAILDAKNMLLAGEATVAIDTTIDLDPLGRVPLKDTVSGEVKVQIAAGSPSASFSGTLIFQDLKIEVKRSIPIHANALMRLSDFVADELQAEIKKAVLADPDRWLKWVYNKTIQGIGEGTDATARLLDQQFHKTATEIATLMRSTGYTAEAVAAALHWGLEGIAPEQAMVALNAADYTTNEAAAAVRKVFPSSLSQLVSALKSINASLTTITSVLSLLGNKAEAVTYALVSSLYELAEVAQSVDIYFKAPYTEIATGMHRADATAEQIGSALQRAFRLTDDQVGTILHEIGANGQEIATTLQKVFSASADDVARFLSKTLPGGSNLAVGEALKGAGYATNEIDKALNNLSKYLDPRKWWP